MSDPEKSFSNLRKLKNYSKNRKKKEIPIPFQIQKKMSLLEATMIMFFLFSF